MFAATVWVSAAEGYLRQQVPLRTYIIAAILQDVKYNIK